MEVIDHLLAGMRVLGIYNNAEGKRRHSPMQTWRSRPPCCGLFARSSVSGLGSTIRWIISLHVMHHLLVCRTSHKRFVMRPQCPSALEFCSDHFCTEAGCPARLLVNTRQYYLPIQSHAPA